MKIDELIRFFENVSDTTKGERAMTASEIMTPVPQTVTPDQSIADAVEIMRNESCGVVPVVRPEDGSTLVGIITDRDIALRACGPGCEGAEMQIEEAMSTNLFVVAPDDTIPHVREVMESAGVRRVPVVDNDQLVGIISLCDVAAIIDRESIGEIDTRILTQDPNN
jgi:CBS domain-containing protein